MVKVNKLNNKINFNEYMYCILYIMALYRTKKKKKFKNLSELSQLEFPVTKCPLVGHKTQCFCALISIWNSLNANNKTVSMQFHYNFFPYNESRGFSFSTDTF